MACKKSKGAQNNSDYANMDKSRANPFAEDLRKFADELAAKRQREREERKAAREAIKEYKCPKCGAPFEEGTLYCTSCYASLMLRTYED